MIVGCVLRVRARVAVCRCRYRCGAPQARSSFGCNERPELSWVLRVVRLPRRISAGNLARVLIGAPPFKDVCCIRSPSRWGMRRASLRLRSKDEARGRGAWRLARDQAHPLIDDEPHAIIGSAKVGGALL